MRRFTIPHKTYDLLEEHDWQSRPSLDLYQGITTYEELFQFAQFMSKSLGFRLRISFPCPGTVRISKI